MANTPTGLDEILVRWRNIVKDKKRQIITPDETIAMKIASLKHWIHPDTEPLDGWEFRQFNYTRHGERVYEDETWRPIHVGATWGGPDMSAEFRCKGTMPGRFKGRKVALKVYFSGDGLLSVNGVPYQGLDPFRDTVMLTERAAGDETYDFHAECYIFWHAGETIIKNFECSHFAVVDPEMNGIYWDLQCAYKAMMAEEIAEPARLFVQEVLGRATRFLDQNEADPEIVRQNARRAAEVVRTDLYASAAFQKTGLMHLNGNSHLDVCFMWTYAEFVRKIGRTHATALRLMEQYPDYIFSQSQPLTYEEMKAHFPDVYEQVKRRIAEGRWEVIGGFYVEPDANLISGESFVRQLLFGVRFTEQEFGRTPKTAWIPDVFGNSWSMPQILAKAGLKFFVTHKMILWNDTNKWNKNVFWWEGPDGTRVFAHVPPTGFIGTMEPDHMTEHWTKFTAKDSVGESLYNYGWGDGGGGPDAEMLESLQRYRNFPGMTPAKPSTNEGALERMYQKALQRDDIPVHNDELYLEEHRGTYTTKAEFKKKNRYCEFLYRNAELFSCFANRPYPQETLNAGWKQVLVNQFHDSLPGSHVRKVYHDIVELYDTAIQTGEQVLQGALEDIAARIDTRGEGQAVVVFNSQHFARDTEVKVAWAEQALHVLDPEGNEVPSQFTLDLETGNKVLVFQAEDVPPAGYKVYRIVEGAGATLFPDVAATATSLENDFVRLTLNSEGELISLFDKETGRECIDAGKRGNVFRLFEDEPGRHEAWDIVSTYRENEFSTGAGSVRLAETGPVRSVLEVTRPFRASRIVQRIVLNHAAPRVDFETFIDWHEQRKLLKVEFNTTLRSRFATYDIAYANIERSTTRNNSYEAAKFEVPAHLWMDLSQADHGLSLINDCKYGHEADGQCMALTLLKGPTFPDPESDLGEHRFTYSLFPHWGDWRMGGTYAEALDLNDPVIAVVTGAHEGDLPPVHSFLMLMTTHGSNVTLEAVKKAEDSDALIVRVVERHGAQEDVTLVIEGDVQSVAECNLLEREDTPVEASGNSVAFVIKPYEIRTFKLQR